MKYKALETRGAHPPVIYFLRDRPTGAIKIGVTSILKERVGTIARTLAVCPELLLVVAGDEDQERRLHCIFAEFRLRFEWYRPAPQILDFVESLRELGLGLAVRGSTPDEVERHPGPPAHAGSYSYGGVSRAIIELNAAGGRSDWKPLVIRALAEIAPFVTRNLSSDPSETSAARGASDRPGPRVAETPCGRGGA